ncbi:MAG TPA: hypothetical protein VNN22_24140 [Verrucomicrobiae bacterium]|nr:hypothetical protein [Verrucomicrobiae bacterium]
MSIAKFQATHAVVNNAPQIISVYSDDPLLVQRIFTGNGAPSASTLQIGNAKYCAAQSGFVVAVSVVAAGINFVAGDVLTGAGGTATTQPQITVDAVTATGQISDWHVSRVGVYTAYPTNPITVTGGTGTGATFNLALQPPDGYLDISTPATPAMWVCTTSGSKSTSVWARVGGGGGTQEFKVVSDGGDYWNCNTWDGITAGGSVIKVAKPYELRCDVGKIASETIDGILFSYAYTAITVSSVITEYKRSATDPSGNIEINYVTPPVIPGKIIVANAFSTTAPSTLVGVPWIFLSSAAWAEV